MKRVFSIEGRVKIRLRRADRIWILAKGPNLVTTAGKEMVAEIVESSPGPTRPSHIALGDDSSAPTVADVALGNETLRMAFATTRSGNEVIYTATRVAIGSEPYSECGIFNDPAAGTMLSRFVFQEVTLEVDDELYIQWTLNYGGY